MGGEFLGDDNVGMLEQFAIIAAVKLGFLYLISGKKTFTCLNNQQMSWSQIFKKTDLSERLTHGVCSFLVRD